MLSDFSQALAYELYKVCRFLRGGVQLLRHALLLTSIYKFSEHALDPQD